MFDKFEKFEKVEILAAEIEGQGDGRFTDEREEQKEILGPLSFVICTSTTPCTTTHQL